MKIKFSSNKDIVEMIKKRLKENGGYCPCRIAKTEENKCMCKEFREQPEGECHCGLYIKERE